MSKKEKQAKKKRENKWKVLYKKALSDMVHLEQRMKADLEHAILLSQRSLLISLLEVLDDIENIIVRSDSKGIEAIKMVRDKLMNTLSTYGVTPIARKEGDKVDPSKDEIVGVVVGKNENVIQRVIRKGYVLNGVTLRPARVIVEKKKL